MARANNQWDRRGFLQSRAATYGFSIPKVQIDVRLAKTVKLVTSRLGVTPSQSSNLSTAAMARRGLR